MTEYLIAFNDEWVPELTDEDLRRASKAVNALRAEMKAAGVLIFTGGLDDAASVRGPPGDLCWSPSLWRSHWARARLHDGRDRHVRIHPTHPDHWAGPPGWDRLCHPKVTALIPFRVSAAPPGRPAPRADERGRPGWARPRHRRELEVNDRVSLCRYAGVVPVGSVRFRLAHRVSCCYRKRADLPIQDHPARPPGQIC